jgi:hypothetical protein
MTCRFVIRHIRCVVSSRQLFKVHHGPHYSLSALLTRANYTLHGSPFRTNRTRNIDTLIDTNRRTAVQKTMQSSQSEQLTSQQNQHTPQKDLHTSQKGPEHSHGSNTLRQQTTTMDQYPELSVDERHDSAAFIAKAAAQQSAIKPQTTAERMLSYESRSSDISVHRSDSNFSIGESDQRIDAEYARYTDAPPPFMEKEYEGKDEEEQTHMRMTDYAKEISRMMGRQLVTGLKTDASEKAKSDENENENST